MACCHHHNHRSSTCCCSQRCETPPCYSSPPPPPSIDPLLLQSIVSQLLQTPQTAHVHHTPPSAAFPAAANCLFDLNSRSTQYPHRRNERHPKHEQFHPGPQPFEGQFQTQYSVLSSLLQRIDVLESSLHRFSSASSSATALTLRHLAARTIQTHFRAYLVRRSRALRELMELDSLKSALNVLRSCLSVQKRIDFFSLSREAMDLIRRLETIQGCDQMVRDSKSSIRREIVQFLEQIGGICVKRNEVSSKMMKHVRMVRNDGKSWVSYAGRESSAVCHRGKSSKHHNLDSDEKRLIENLRARVERIQGMCNILEDNDDYNHDFDEGIIKKHRPQSHVPKRVCFLEDGNVAWVYDIHEDGREATSRISENVEKSEDSDDKQHEDEGEVESDTEVNPSESAEGSYEEEEAPTGTQGGSSQGSEGEETPRQRLAAESDKKGNPSRPRQNGKLILSAPVPVKMEGRADLVKKQNGVKIVG